MVDGRTLEPKQNENCSESKDSLTEREVFDADLEGVLGEDVLCRAPRLRLRGRRRGHVGPEQVVHRRRLSHAGLAQQDDGRVVGAPVKGITRSKYKYSHNQMYL